jgi:hypothetical protein
MMTPAYAQGAGPIPRTASGRPNLEGNWTSRWLTPVERPEGVSALVVDDKDAERLANEILRRAAHPGQLDPELAYPDAETLARVRGEWRTSLIVSPATGKLPFTEAGRRAQRAYIGGMDDPEQRMTTERCLGGVGWAPLQIRTASMIRQLVHTDDHLVIHSEAYSDLRIIPIGDAGVANGTPYRSGGVSTAHWEGDTLVVETARLDPRTSTHGIVTVLSPEARITERFDMHSPNEIVYRYTIDDPAYYSSSWTGEYSLTRSDSRVYEFACHEGNYSMTHMLAGARREDRLRRESSRP